MGISIGLANFVLMGALFGALTTGCGSSSDAGGGGGGNGAGGAGGAGNGKPLFAQAPVCETFDNLKQHGTLDGTPLDDVDSAVSNLSSTLVQAGVGQIANGGFGWAFEALVGHTWVKGETQDFAVINGKGSSYYVGGEHALKGQQLCITGGQIGPLLDVPGDVIFQWHITGFSKGTMLPPATPQLGTDCGGAVVPADLYGCLKRDSPYFP